MPRVWHQPSLGKVNTWMFLHLEHGRCLRNISYLFFSIVTVATPCWGFGTQHGLIFSRFWYLAFCYYSSDPSFLLFKAEFTLLSRAPNSLGSDSSAVSSLCVFMDTRIFLGNFLCFGLVGTFIKTNFVFRYARYAIKSDYSNLIFNLCLRFLSWRNFFCNRIH